MSSSPDSFQSYFDSHEPKQELDSPFLSEEYLVEEASTAQTWKTPLPGFQLESPFLEAFEEGWGAINETEVEEFEEFLGELDEKETISVYPEEDAAVFTEAEDDEHRESDFETEAALQFFVKEQSDAGISTEYEEDSAYLDREADSEPDTEIEAEGGISGDDDRTEVRDTTIPPYRWICSISYEKNGQTLNGGTGFLISNRHVLTAGHVITEAGSGPAAPSIYVYPGRHYGGEPFGRFSVAKTWVSPSRLDFGLITLKHPVDQGLLWWGAPSTRTVWWSETLLPAQQLLRTAIPISTAGYPGVKDAYRRRMYKADGSTMPSAFGAIFRHTADTTQGQSGSPIWTVRGGLHVLLGIATSYDQMPGQRATWVGEIVRRDIERCMAEDAPKAPRVERRIALEIPYRWICRLEVYDNDLRRAVGFGTGLLISNRHVLTAARVIHDFSRDRRRYSVRITPGYEFGKEAFGSTTASKARLSPKYSPESKDGSVDYGLLTLARPLGSVVFSLIGNTALGNWGNESHGLSTTPADWSGKAAHIAVFSRSSGGGAGYHKLRVSTGAIVGLQRGQILHKASSKLDAPGAPIWIEAGKRRLLVGIASSVFSKDSGLNLGCYLSQETQNQLMQWVNEDYEQTELEVRDLSQDELEFVLASPDTETEWSPELSAEEGEVITGVDYEDELELLHEQPLEERFDPSDISQDVADALKKKNWSLALKLAIQKGWRDENKLTNLIFFTRHPELPNKPLNKKQPKFGELSAEWTQIRDTEVKIAIRASAVTAVKKTKMPMPTTGQDSIDVHAINLPLFHFTKKRPNLFEVKQAPGLANCPVASILAALAFTAAGKALLQKMLTTTAAPTVTDISEVKSKKSILSNPPSGTTLDSYRFFTVKLPGGPVDVSDVLYTDDHDDGWSPIYMRDPGDHSIWAAIIEKALAVKLGSYENFNALNLKANDFWKKIVGKNPGVLEIKDDTPLRDIIEAAKASTRVASIGASKPNGTKIVTEFHGFAMLGLDGNKIKLYDPAESKTLSISPSDFRHNFQTILFHK